MKSFKLFTFFTLLSCALIGQGNGTSFKSTNKCHNKTYSVAIHILTDTLGNKNVSDASIAAGIAIANTHFSKICVAFNICSTYVHPNVRNDKIRPGIEDKEIAAMYDVPNTINIYYALEVSPLPEICCIAPIGGMTVPAKTSDRDAIFVEKGFAASTTVTTLLGHYFGLFSTNDNVTNGAEFANGSNCETAGDLICDTKAAPILTSGTRIINCNVNIQDANGDYYTPDFCNLMLIGWGSPCNSQYFTTGQYDRMLEVMEKGRNYLW